jgi:mannose-P-dolichol utilization defect protein 1
MTSSNIIAERLGYLLGIGSLALYTPILFRIIRNCNAEGIAMSTFWLKLVAYCCSDIYSISRGYPLSTYIEVLVLTLEAALVLVTVAYLQAKIDTVFVTAALALVLTCAWALVAAPIDSLAFASIASTILNSGALVPQIILNARRGSSGDYSPLTAAIASGGCILRLFTVVRLSSSDPLLLINFGSSLALNCTLLAQLIWYSIIVEKRPWSSLILRDFEEVSAEPDANSTSKPQATELSDALPSIRKSMVVTG